MYGVRTHFKRSPEWKLLRTDKTPTAEVLERCIFRHRNEVVYLVADAYRGSKIHEAVEHFLNAAAGKDPLSLQIDDAEIAIAGGADLVAYVGHNGLMDFALPEPPTQDQPNPKEAIILACMSKAYFAERLKRIGALPVLLTTNFMAPEAYTLEAALAGWVAKESPKDIALRAAKAYNTHQKCGIKGAQRLFDIAE